MSLPAARRVTKPREAVSKVREGGACFRMSQHRSRQTEEMPAPATGMRSSLLTAAERLTGHWELHEPAEAQIAGFRGILGLPSRA